MAVILIAAGVVVWLLSLPVLWGWAFDSSGTFTWLWALSLLFTCRRIFVRREANLARAMRALQAMGLAGRVPLADAIAGQIGSSRDDAEKRMRLLAAATIFAVLGLILATLVIPLAAAGGVLLGELFLFGQWTWRVLEVLALLVGSTFVATGIAAVVYASAVVRASGGRDTYAAALRDLLWGAAVGFAGFAVAWWFGANLIFLDFAIAGGMGAVALTAVSRLDLPTHPRKALLPFGRPGRIDRLVIAVSWGALLGVLLVQVRLLGDVFGLSLSRRMIWVFLSLGALVWFLGRIDRKSYVPGKGQIAGASLGVCAAVLAQLTELLLVSQWTVGAGRTTVGVLAIATQIPLAALAATLLASQRRSFALGGGTAGEYFAAVFGGLLWAGAAWALAGAIAWGWWVIPTITAGGVLGGAVYGALRARAGRLRVQWVAWGAVLTVAFGGGLWHVASVDPRQTQRGGWLTHVYKTSRRGRDVTRLGVLPDRPGRRSELITGCAGELFAHKPGRWWLVATSAEDIPAELPSRFYASGASPQPMDLPERARHITPPLSPAHPDYFRYARENFVARRGYDFFDGIFLAPLPADHPQAWRCYNDKLLRRCVAMACTGDGRWGSVVLRSQAGPGQVRRLLNVARSFADALLSRNARRPGWAVVAITPGGVDLLLIGPGEVVDDELLASLRRMTQNSVDTFCVPIDKLWPGWSDLDAVYLFAPPPERLDGVPTIKGFRDWLVAAERLASQP